MQHAKQYPSTTWHARVYRWSQRERVYPKLESTTKCRYWWSIPLAPFSWLLIRVVLVLSWVFMLAEELADKLPKREYRPRPINPRKKEREEVLSALFVLIGLVFLYVMAWISHPGYTLLLTVGVVVAAAAICLLWKLASYQPLWRRLQQIKRYAHDKKELVCPIVEIVDAD